MQKNWNLKLLYNDINDKDIQRDIDESKKNVKLFVKKWKNNNEYLKNPKTLSIALKEYEELMQEYGICTKPSYYIFLSREIDQENPLLKAKENLLHSTCLELENSIQFFLLNISKIPKQKQKQFLESEDLKIYKHFLLSSFNQAKYLLTDKEEKIFNLESKTSHANWINMLSELLQKQSIKILNEKGIKKEVSYSETSKYLDSSKKEVRDYTAEQFYKVNNRYAQIAEYEINSILENKKISDEYRKIPRVDLPRLLSDDMEPYTVDTLRNVVTESFDISQRFYKLKAKLLKQESLAYYERNVKVDDIKQEFSFEKSINIVKEVFKKLDKEFLDIMQMYQSQGQYDVYPKRGKEGGAFCVGVGSKYPTYILLNHNDRLQDVLTIAHESGHGIHTEYSNKQNPLNQGYSTACAEVASTFFENFVLENITENLSEKEKDLLLFKSLEEDVSTIFRQIACYNFELELHKQFRDKGFLSKDDISKIFTQEMSKYLGESVLKDKHMQLGWIYWSHIRSFFYTYSYASGLLISKYLQNLVKEDTQNIKYVKEFFKAGDSKSPKEIFLDMGMDISKKEFWETGLKEIEEKLSYLEKKL
ncbi:MAG TPA: M3 family oligoendopeptidase [Candidatus Dojkabacteria bacterium]|nr:M3 family oligoendopeptidase [Candidatus Dojkabacteria bacterium]